MTMRASTLNAQGTVRQEAQNGLETNIRNPAGQQEEKENGAPACAETFPRQRMMLVALEPG
jgi:hypothetical protein